MASGDQHQAMDYLSEGGDVGDGKKSLLNKPVVPMPTGSSPNEKNGTQPTVSLPPWLWSFG